MNEYRSLKEVQSAIKSGITSVTSLVEGYLRNIEAKKQLNAFVETFDDSAKTQAEKVDQKIKEGRAGRLAGMVIGIKDNICYKGHKVSASSKILDGFTSLYNATVTERLIAEDAVIIGRLNCDEFAMGSSNETSAYGPVLNPYDETRVSGGSSGGSAVAVAANLCLATLGSDTGGSIRQPASFCGTVGYKPTYGRVSRWGLIAYGSSLDQIGPFTHTVEDTALIMEIISGKDEFDTTASSKPVPNYSALNWDKPAKIGVLSEALHHSGISEDVRNELKNQIQQLKEAGHTVEEISFPFLDKMVPTYYVISNAEASSNLSRFDGVHYGHRSEEAHDINSTFVNSRTEGFGKEVQRRIMMGTFVLSAGYFDAYYGQAQKVRRIIRERTLEIFEEYDFMLLPTTPHAAFKINDTSKDAISMYLEDIFTVQANLAGTPAISLPLGTNSQHMPFGIQLMAKPFADGELLAFSATLMNK